MTAVIGILFVVVGAEPVLMSGSVAPEQVLDEAPQAQRQLRGDLVEGLSFDAKNRIQLRRGRGSSPDVISELRAEYRVVYSFPSIARETLLDSARAYGGLVTCVNTEYAFELKRSGRDSGWSATGIETTDVRTFLLRGWSDGLNDLSRQQLFCHYWLPVLDIEGIPIEHFFAQSVTIDSASRESDGRIMVNFHGDVPTPTGPDRVVGGTVWLVPGKSWAVDEYDVELFTSGGKGEPSNDGKSRVQKVVEWSEVDGLPVPSSVTLTYSGAPEFDIPASEHRWRYTNWERKRYPAERFLMSHYGLPEPGLARKSGPKPWLWINIIGLLLIALGITIRLRSIPSVRDD